MLMVHLQTWNPPARYNSLEVFEKATDFQNFNLKGKEWNSEVFLFPLPYLTLWQQYTVLSMCAASPSRGRGVINEALKLKDVMHCTSGCLPIPKSVLDMGK